jgi:hypothetical protein
MGAVDVAQLPPTICQVPLVRFVMVGNRWRSEVRVALTVAVPPAMGMVRIRSPPRLSVLSIGDALNEGGIG